MKTKLFVSSVIAAIASAVMLPGTFAAAQDGTDPYVSPSPVVAEVTTVPPSPDAVDVPSSESAAPTDVASSEWARTDVASTNLAFTGGDVAALVALGLAAIVIGSTMTVLRNRHRGADSPA